MDKKIIVILISLILTSTILEFKFGNLSLTPIQGNWENNDQTLQVPAVYSISKDSLFQNDPIIKEYIKIYPTFLFSITAVVYNIFSDMVLTYFVLFLVLKAIFIFSVYLLSNLLLKNKKLALLAALSLSFTHFMGADEIGLTEVVPKNFVFAFMPLIFYLFLRDRKKYSIPCFILLGALSYFHIFSVIPVFLMFLYSHASKKEYRKLFKSFILYAIIAAPSFILLGQSTGSIDHSILSVVPYTNLANGFVTTVKYLPIILIGVFYLLRKGPEISNAKEIIAWFIIAILYSLISILGIFSDRILLLTLYRSMKYVIFFSFIFSSYIIFGLYRKKRILSLAACAIITIYFSSLYYSTILTGITKDTSVYSPEVGDVTSVGRWIDSNLPKDQAILIPPDWGSIRIWAKRQAVIAEADYYILKFSSDKFPDRDFYTNEIKDVYSSGNSSKIIEVSKRAGADYIITHDQDLGLQPVFSSGKFRVYRT